MASIENAYVDYRDLLTTLKDENSIDNVYELLMAKEQNRVDLINRVVEQKDKLIWHDSIFYNMSLVSIATNFSSVWMTIFKEIVVEKPAMSLETIQRIFFDGDRKIYVGMMVVIISIFFFFVSATS